MKTLLASVVIGACATALPLIAAAQSPQSGGRLDLVVRPEPPGLMLGMISNGPTGLVAGSIYESLLRYDDKLEPQPSLAKSWEISEDGLVYTFHLQDNVKWHDGAPFGVKDVLFSVRDFVPTFLAKARATMAHVAKVEAPDTQTVVFTLTAPFEPFIRAFNYGSLPMVPAHIYEGTDYKTNPMNDTPIGAGPFKFEKWDKGSFIELVKFDDYHLAGKPYLDEIYWHIIPDAASRAVAFETGQISVLPGGSVENFDIPRLTGLDGVCVTDKGWEYFSPLSWMWINNRKAPMNDVRFRQAIMHAMNREFMVDVLWNGAGRVATGPITTTTPYYKAPETPFYPYDPSKAKALLEAMDYDGAPIKLLPLPYGETWQRRAEVVKQNLAEVGIPVELQATDVAGWNQRVADWDYDLAFTYLYQNADPALGVARNYISTEIKQGSPWNNVEGYSNPKVDAAFAAGADAWIPAERAKAYGEAQDILREEVPVAWLTEIAFPTIYKCGIEDLVTTASGLNTSLRDAWISK